MFTRLQRLRGRAFQTSLRWYSNVEFPFAREFLVFTELGKNLGRSTGKRDWNGAVFQRFDSPWTILFLFRMRVNFIFTGEFNSLSPSFLCFFLFFLSLFSSLFFSFIFLVHGILPFSSNTENSSVSSRHRIRVRCSSSNKPSTFALTLKERLIAV